ARRIAAQQTDNLAPFDPVVDRFQDVKIAVMGVDVDKLKHREGLEQFPTGRRGIRHARALSRASTRTHGTSPGVTDVDVLLETVMCLGSGKDCTSAEIGAG